MRRVEAPEVPLAPSFLRTASVRISLKGRAVPRKIKVAQVSDVAPGEGKIVQADGEQIALFNVGGRFYAIHNTCLHRGGPLGEGELDETTVTCPWHGWQYDVATGANVRNPAVKVASFNVKIEGTDVLVELP